MCVSCVGTVPCPADVTKFSTCESHHQQPQTLNYTARLPTGGNLRMLDQGCRVEGVTLSNQILCRLPKYPNLFAALHCHDKQDFRWILVKLSLYEMLPVFCQCPDAGITVDCIPYQHCIHKNCSFTVPEESDGVLAHWWKLLKLFSAREIKIGAIPWIAFLFSLVHNDGPKFHLL